MDKLEIDDKGIEIASQNLQPGEFFSYDFRDKVRLDHVQVLKDAFKCLQAGEPADRITSPLKIITWNIERGYCLPAILVELEKLDADIICLQEIDSGCTRSHCVDTGVALARGLKMNYVFQLEFIELGSGSSPERHGVHGNGILTKFDIGDLFSIDHPTQPYNWERDGILLNEPRLGRRFSFAAAIQVPSIYLAASIFPESLSANTSFSVNGDSTINETTPLVCYTCHMELFCGITDRVKIISELFDHSRELASKGFDYQVILGDFNTLAHSLARFSGKYCKDSLRWKSLGWTEAEWISSSVLDFYDSDGPKNTILPTWGLTFDDKTLAAVRNPFLEESFASNVETLTNYRGWFYGKLDWALTRGLAVVHREIHNMDYKASDHRLIILYTFLDKTRVDYIKSTNQLPPFVNLPQKEQRMTGLEDLFGLLHVQQYNYIRGHALYHRGFRGYLKRNCTVFVRQVMAFVFCVVMALLLYMVFPRERVIVFFHHLAHKITQSVYFHLVPQTLNFVPQTLSFFERDL